MAQQSLQSILKDHGLRVTEARMAVLRVLIQSAAALSRGEIAEALPGCSYDKATLYRTLDAFVDKGLAHQVPTRGRTRLYAVTLEEVEHHEEAHHAHFICEQCRQVFCLPDTSLSGPGPATEADGFVVHEREVRLKGLCPDCH